MDMERAEAIVSKILGRHPADAPVNAPPWGGAKRPVPRSADPTDKRRRDSLRRTGGYEFFDRAKLEKLFAAYENAAEQRIRDGIHLKLLSAGGIEDGATQFLIAWLRARTKRAYAPEQRLAIGLLSRFGSGEIAELLAHLVRHASDPMLRAAAAQSARATHGATVRDALIAALDASPEPVVVDACVAGLMHFESHPAAARALAAVRATGASAVQVRLEAEQLDPAVASDRRRLLEILARTETTRMWDFARMTAAGRLARVITTDAEVRSVLIERMTSDRSWEVRHHIAHNGTLWFVTAEAGSPGRAAFGAACARVARTDASRAVRAAADRGRDLR